MASKGQKKFHVLTSDVEKKWLVNPAFPVPKTEFYSQEVNIPEYSEGVDKANKGIYLIIGFIL